MWESETAKHRLLRRIVLDLVESPHQAQRMRLGQKISSRLFGGTMPCGSRLAGDSHLSGNVLPSRDRPGEQSFAPDCTDAACPMTCGALPKPDQRARQQTEVAARSNQVALRCPLVPSGSFMMGSPPDAPGRNKPVRIRFSDLIGIGLGAIVRLLQRQRRSPPIRRGRAGAGHVRDVAADRRGSGHGVQRRVMVRGRWRA